jgi:hypothetical protein
MATPRWVPGRRITTVGPRNRTSQPSKQTPWIAEVHLNYSTVAHPLPKPLSLKVSKNGFPSSLQPRRRRWHPKWTSLARVTEILVNVSRPALERHRSAGGATVPSTVNLSHSTPNDWPWLDRVYPFNYIKSGSSISYSTAKIRTPYTPSAFKILSVDLDFDGLNSM